MAEIFEKVSFDPYNFRITRLSARKSERMKTFEGMKICVYLPFKYENTFNNASLGAPKSYRDFLETSFRSG